MNNIRTLLKLEFKDKFSKFSASNKNAYLKVIGSLIMYAAVVYGIFLVSRIFFQMFDKADMGYESLVLIFTVLLIFLCFTGVSSTVKVLFYKGDNEILMRYPVKGEEIFISKTLFLIINQIMITAVIVAPLLVAYSEVMELGSEFIRVIPIAIMFLVLIPFFVSNIFAIPIMHLTNRIRNKFGLIIIGLTIGITLLFAVYMFLFNKMVTFIGDKEFSVFDEGFVTIVKDVCKYLIPTKYFADILVGKELYIAYPVLIMILGITLCGTILVVMELYPKTLLKNVETEGSAFKHVTKNRVRPIFFTLLHKEFLQVFRSVNYSFQYFVLACAMPVMVYFCNSIAMQLGKNQIGEQISVGMTMLVMLIFATVISSFSATSVSREGDCFYHTKVAPVSIELQLFVKFTMYFIVSFLANIICVVVLIYAGLMETGTALWLFLIVELICIGLILRSMRYDVKKPYFNLSGEGEVVNNNVNTTRSVGLGFGISLIEGMLGMILGYIMDFATLQIVCSAIAVVFFLYALLSYCIGLRKTYNKIAK